MTTFTGTAGNDTLIGGAGADSFTASGGMDRIWGAGGADTLTLTGAFADYDVVLNGDGAFTLTDRRAGSPDGSIFARDVESYVFTDRTATAGEVTGGLFHRVAGTAGNDVLRGTLGVDELIGGAGHDRIWGSTGADRAVYSGAASNYVVTANGNGSWTVLDLRAAGDGIDIVRDVETLVFSDGAMAVEAAATASAARVGRTITGTAGNDTLNAYATNGVADAQTNDVITGGGGNDVILGAAGNDLILGDRAGGADADNLVVNGSFETTVVKNGGWGFFATLAGWQTTSRFEIWSSGMVGHTAAQGNTFLEIDVDSKVADSVFQQVRTEAGQSYQLSFQIAQRSGTTIPDNPVRVLWNGVEVAKVLPSSTAWSTINLQVIGTGGLDRLEFADEGATSNSLGGLLDNVVLTKAGHDWLHGGLGIDTLDGGAGNDTLEGGEGADVLRGGAGIDTADYTWAKAAVVVDLWAGGTGGEALGDTYDSIENIDGSDFADTLKGNGGANYIIGEAGGDTLWGGAGDDMLQGDTGGDRIDGGDGFDTATYFSAASGVTVNLGTGLGTAGEAAGDVLVSIEKVMGSNVGADILVGSANVDTLWGMGGNDTLLGGAGADKLDGGNGDDRMEGEAGNDFMVGQAGDDLMFGGDGADNVQGGAGKDTLAGGAGNDALWGGAGDDVLEGGAGNDRLRGGLGADRFVFGSIDAGASDLVLDFGLGADVIDLRGLGLSGFDALDITRTNAREQVIHLHGADGSADIVVQSTANLTLTADHFLFA